LTAFARGTLSDSNGDGVPDTVASAGRSQAWSIDAAGNFNSVTENGGPPTSRTTNKQNQVTAVGSSALTYDRDGNTTTDNFGQGLTYDAWNRLVRVYGGGTGANLAYGYDALGWRVVEWQGDFTSRPQGTGEGLIIGGQTNHLYYSAAWQVLEERGDVAAWAQYVWSPVYVDALVERDRDADGNAANGLEERLYALQDANYNVTALVNTSGSVVERYAYDPYGQPAVLTPAWATRGASAYGWRYLHQGLRYDGIAGLYDDRARAYSPTLMRFLQNDPKGLNAGDPDLYSYVGNDPVNKLDPMGLQPPGGHKPYPYLPRIPGQSPHDDRLDPAFFRRRLCKGGKSSLGWDQFMGGCIGLCRARFGTNADPLLQPGVRCFKNFESAKKYLDQLRKDTPSGKGTPLLFAYRWEPGHGTLNPPAKTFEDPNEVDPRIGLIRRKLDYITYLEGEDPITGEKKIVWEHANETFREPGSAVLHSDELGKLGPNEE
jgi:RHS repeat-associated protein